MNWPTFWLIPVALIVVAIGLHERLTSGDADAVDILFIGNSLTASNDLSGLVAKLAGSRNIRVNAAAHAPSGATLRQHARSAAVRRRLRERDWEFVVLQEQSQLPGLGGDQVARDVLPFARSLARTVREHNPEASLVFYMTMARRDGDRRNRHVAPELATYAGAQRRINRTYLRMAKTNRALLAPVGEVWRIVRRKRPQLSLYTDGVHPNKAGTYLTACVLFATLFQSPCSDATARAGVDPGVREFLHKTTDDVVFSTGRRWDWRR